MRTSKAESLLLCMNVSNLPALMFKFFYPPFSYNCICNSSLMSFFTVFELGLWKFINVETSLGFYPKKQNYAGLKSKSKMKLKHTFTI